MNLIKRMRLFIILVVYMIGTNALAILPTGVQDVIQTTVPGNFISGFTLSTSSVDNLGTDDPAGIYFETDDNRDIILTVNADGSNLETFDLTGIDFTKFSNDGTFTFTVTGIGGTTPITTFKTVDNSFTYDDIVPDYSAFTGITGFTIRMVSNSISLHSQNTFDKFTIANAQAPSSTKAEPTTHPTAFTATADSTSQITTAWTDATDTVIPDSYLLMCSTSNAFTNPVDTTAQTNDTDCADGAGVQNVSQGTGTVVWTGLTAGTQYFYKIYPYTNSGSDVDYKVDGTVLEASVTTTAESSIDEDFTGLNDSLRTNPFTQNGMVYTLTSPSSGNAIVTFIDANNFVIAGTNDGGTSDQILIFNFSSTGTLNGPAGTADFRIARIDGSKFKIASMQADMSAQLVANGYIKTITVSGFRDSILMTQDTVDFDNEDSSGSVTYTESVITAGSGGKLTFDTNWQNIDEIRFTTTDGSKIAILGIDELDFGTAISSTKAQPTTHPTAFTATANSTTQITTAWTDATDTVIPDSYLLMCSTSNSFTAPVDGTFQADASTCDYGFGIQNITQGVGTVAWTGLMAGTQYFYKIYPYSNTGSDVDYKTDATVGTANATTTSPPTAPTINGTNGTTITGTGEVGATVTVRDASNTVIGTAVVDANGNWTMTANPVVGNATVLTATQAHTVGNDSIASSPQTVDTINDATLTSSSTVNEPVNLPSTADTRGEAVNVFDFTISDGGGGDGLSTDVSQIVLHTSGTADFSKVRWRLSGAGVFDVTGTYDSGANTLTFPSLFISVADGTNETYTLSGYYDDPSNLTNNQTYIFSLNGDNDLTVSGSGTQMSGGNSAVNNGSGTQVEITATKLIFQTEPSN